MIDPGLPIVFSTRALYIAVQVHTEANFKQQAFEENVLSICRFIPNANSLIQRTEPGFDQIHCPQTVRSETYSSTVTG